MARKKNDASFAAALREGFAANAGANRFPASFVRLRMRKIFGPEAKPVLDVAASC